MTITERSERTKQLWRDPEARRRILLGQEKARAAKTLSGPAILAQFWARVEKSISPDGCWTWLGSVNNHGYGSISIMGKAGDPILAHRFVYELLVGPIPEGRELDHRCRNRRCVNPAHLEVVTRSENCSRGDSGLAWAAHQRSKTHCPQGHPYDLFNTYYDKNGGRQCRICRREHMQSYRKQKREVFETAGLPYQEPWERR